MFDVDIHMPCSEVYELFKKEKIRHAPVTENGQLKGIISLTDISKIGESRWLEKFTANDLMSLDPYRVKEGTDARLVVREMKKRHIHSVLVCNHKNHPIGIFTATDAFELLVELIEDFDSDKSRGFVLF